MKLGLKGSIHEEQLIDRLKRRPDILEFHLFEDDLFGKNRERLEKCILLVQELGIRVILHHPIKYRSRKLDILHVNTEDRLYYNISTHILAEIVKKHGIHCVIHVNYSNIPFNKEDYEKELGAIKTEIQRFNELSEGRFLWENSCDGAFSFINDRIYEDIIEPLGLNICFDISHAFITFQGDNEKLKDAMEKTRQHTKYYHVVDSMGKEHDSLTLGKGKIDWENIEDLIKGKPYIYEIDLKDQTNCDEMLRSHQYFKSLDKKSG